MIRPTSFVNDKYQNLCRVVQDIDKTLCGKVSSNEALHARCLIKSIQMEADVIFKEYVSLVNAYERLDKKMNTSTPLPITQPGPFIYNQQRPNVAIDPDISLRRKYYKLRFKHKKLKKKYKKLLKKCERC